MDRREAKCLCRSRQNVLSYRRCIYVIRSVTGLTPTLPRNGRRMKVQQMGAKASSSALETTGYLVDLKVWYDT